MKTWTEQIGKAIGYIESHLTEELTMESIAKYVNLSPFYFQKGFRLLCGYTIAEYIRNRRLALAGRELAEGNLRVIDTAIKYGYDSPDSFTKAFTRFHGVTPSMVQKEGVMLKAFAPLKIRLSLEGGCKMEYRISKRRALPCWAFHGNFPTRMQMRLYRHSGGNITKKEMENMSVECSV